jgi:hypothetical protein
MTDWNEKNFLERLAPQLRQKSAGVNGACPDASTLCAVVEGEAPQAERDSVIVHVSQCAACADLWNRLLQFEQGGPREPEAAWNQTRTRLDNWMEGFLHSQAAQIHAPKRGRLSRSLPGGKGISSLFTSRKLIWSMSVALALVLIVDGVLFFVSKRGQPTQGQVAARRAVPPQAPQQGPQTPIVTPRAEGLPTAGNPISSGVENPNGPRSGGPGAPPAPVIASAPAGPNPSGQLTQAGPAPHPNPSLPTPRPASNPPAVSAISAPTGEGHPALWLDPASHLMIVLSSIHINPDGSFQFQATLLLRVAQSGPVPLDRGAQIIGVGTIRNGQTSMAVTEMVVQGARYTLKEGNGAMNAQTPGAGGVVDFKRSQVVEMWPADTASYEKVSGPIASPEPQK